MTHDMIPAPAQTTAAPVLEQLAAKPRGLSWPLKAYGALRSTLLNLGAVIGTLSLLLFAGSLVFGVTPLNVISGSMEPGIPTGSMIFSRTVQASEVAPGDIITVNRVNSNDLVTHRVVSIEKADGGAFAVVLKGDANEQRDPESYLITQARSYLFQVNGLGVVSEFFGRPFGMSLLLLLGAILVFVFLFPARSFARQPASAHASASSNDTPSTSSGKQ